MKFEVDFDHKDMTCGQCKVSWGNLTRAQWLMTVKDHLFAVGYYLFCCVLGQMAVTDFTWTYKDIRL